MKKIMKKMLSVVMVAAVALGLGFAPAKAAGEIVVHVEKPADWADSMNLYTYGDAGELLGAWPGTAMTTDADGFYTGKVAADKASIVVNDGNGLQSTDIKDLAAGEYWFVAGTAVDGKMEFVDDTANHAAAPAAEATDDAAATAEPATGDATPVVLVSLIGLAAVAVFAASKKRNIA